MSLSAVLPDQFFGDAYDPEGNLLFTERHEVIKKNGEIIEIRTEVFDLQQRPLAIMRSNFESSRYLPNFMSERFVDGLLSRSIKDHSNVVLLKKEKSWHDYLSKTYLIEPDMVVGHGYYFFLIDHIRELLSSKKQTDLAILVPNRLEKEDLSMSVDSDPNNANIVQATLIPKNPFHRMIVPKMTVRINLQNNWLVSFEGPNTFLDLRRIIPYIKIIYHE